MRSCCGPTFGVANGAGTVIEKPDCCAPALGIIDGVENTGLETLQITLPPSSFMTDPRSSYDGLVGGTGGQMFVAIPGNTDRAFFFTQSDGATQRGTNPQGYTATLAGYSMVQVSLAAGLVTAANVGAALAAAAAAFAEYTVVDLGNGVVTIRGPIDADGAFTGGTGTGNADSARNRGQSGLWGMRLNTPNTFGSYGQGPVSSCASQHAVAPAVAGTRAVAMDVFIGTTHNAGDQFRLGLYEGGGAVDPTGATLLYDFGQISGVATNTWVRVWVAVNDVVLVGNATNLWLTCKSNVALTDVGGVFTGSGGNGNLTDQDFWQSASMSADATVVYPGTYTAGGAHGSTFIFALRLIYQATPYEADGSWIRRFGVHVAASVAPNAAPINSQLMMGANPPNALGMKLDAVRVPYGAIHNDAGGQYRIACHQGGAVLNPNTAPLEIDLGQTAGTATNAYVTMTAPGPGPSEVDISNTSVLWWTVKNNNGTLGVGSEVAFSNGNPGGIAIASPADNPMDWVIPTGVGTGSEYELFGTNPTINPDPTVAYPATVTTDATDQMPGNIPYGVIDLRINGIALQRIA